MITHYATLKQFNGGEESPRRADSYEEHGHVAVDINGWYALFDIDSAKTLVRLLELAIEDAEATR